MGTRTVRLTLSMVSLSFSLLIAGTSSATAWEKGNDAAKLKLVLQITVDQLRGDLPTRYVDRLGQGGFRYLLEKGTHYANAHYRHGWSAVKTYWKIRRN